MNDMKRQRAGALILVVVALLMTACAAHYRESVRARGVYHKVKKGETLYSIARTYAVDLQELAEVNNITDPTVVAADDAIFIPDAREVREVKQPPVKRLQKIPAKPSPIVKKTPPVKKKETIAFTRGQFIWPVNGTIVSKFGIQPGGMRFNGIKIKSRDGTSVMASAAGRVIHSSPLKYYGETIIIKHNNNFTTVYSHLKKRMVSKDENVLKGQVIALLGKHKSSSNCCLHFEIRKRNKPKNPLFYLPKSK